MISSLLVGSVLCSTTPAPGTTSSGTTTPAQNEWNVVCDGAGQDWCVAKQDAWAHCSCDGDKLNCPGQQGSKCLPGPKSQYNCKCINGPPPAKCTANYNMGCAPGKEGTVPCCKGLICQVAAYSAGQCLAPDPAAPSTNPYQPQQISEQGWHIGCTSDISKKDGMTQFFRVGSKELIDGAKVDIKQFIKGADGAKDLALGFCSKECKTDKDCPKVTGTTNSCVEAATGLKICASSGDCLDGMMESGKMCVSMNPFRYEKNQLNYHTYFPVPNNTHGGYHSQQWDMSKSLKSYLPLHLSNWIGGILLGQMLKNVWNWPIDNGSIKKEYIYGTLMGQLFQESGPSENPKDIENNIVNPDIHLLDVGQGGPWQLNDYSKQLPPGIHGARGMLNYNSLYHALGYTVEEQNNDGPNSQTKKRGPKMLNSVDHGPMVAAYFHFNDINRYDLLESQSYAKKDQAENWKKCKANIVSGKYKNPDVMLNVIYNAGPYDSFAQMVFELCANVDKYPQQMEDLLDYSLDDDQFVQKFEQFTNKPVAGTTYILYPRQINYYVDQFINDNESLYKRNGAFSDVNVPFTLQDVVSQFEKSFTGLGYKNKEGKYALIDADFLKKNQPQGDLTKALSFSNSADRNEFFKFVEDWIAAMEKAEDFKFSDSTQCNQKVGEKMVTECAPPVPQCDARTPPGFIDLCTCQEDKVTKKMSMHCRNQKMDDMMKKTYHCTCEKNTGTTTAAPIPQKGEPCSAQNCADGLGCLASVWVDGAEINSEFRYLTEKQTCQEYSEDPMINHLIKKENGSVADGESCAKSKDCGEGSVCVQEGVWIGSSQADAECRSSSDADCKCKKATESNDALIKKFLKSRRLAIYV